MAMFSQSRSVNAVPGLQRAAVLILVLAVLLAFLGPFGTALTMSPISRAAYWLVAVGTIGGSMIALRSFADRKLFSGCAPAWFVLTVAFLCALPGAFLIRACLAYWSPQALTHIRISELGLDVLLLNLIGATAELVLRRHAQMRLRAGSADDPQGTSRFMSRLPIPLARSRLVAIEAQDHYIRVHTDAGCALLHMRISDAESLLSPGEGLRVHRSFWVARPAIERIERRSGRQFLHLSNGLCVPVSRARQAVLAEAGLL